MEVQGGGRQVEADGNPLNQTEAPTPAKTSARSRVGPLTPTDQINDAPVQMGREMGDREHPNRAPVQSDFNVNEDEEEGSVDDDDEGSADGAQSNRSQARRSTMPNSINNSGPSKREAGKCCKLTSTRSPSEAPLRVGGGRDHLLAQSGQ
jgi:hypothetical protein